MRNSPRIQLPDEKLQQLQQLSDQTLIGKRESLELGLQPMQLNLSIFLDL